MIIIIIIARHANDINSRILFREPLADFGHTPSIVFHRVSRIGYNTRALRHARIQYTPAVIIYCQTPWG